MNVSLDGIPWAGLRRMIAAAMFFMAVGLRAQAEPEIEVEAMFPTMVTWKEDGTEMVAESDAIWEREPVATVLPEFGSSAVLSNLVMQALAEAASLDLLSAPKVRVRSGEKGSVKVVTTYRFPNTYAVHNVELTNGVEIVKGVFIVPGDYAQRDVGIMLDVTPKYDAAEDVIALDLNVEIVSEPTWKSFTVAYEGTDGKQRTLPLEQPFFGTRRIDTTLELRNGSSVVIGENVSQQRTSVEERVPVLGAIPLLGRAFRRERPVVKRTVEQVVISARVVEP